MSDASLDGIVCAQCGTPAFDDHKPCISCGSTTRRYSMTIRAAAKATGALGFVHDSPPSPGKAHTIAVQTVTGARSEARLEPDGTVAMTAAGPPDVGTRGESEVRSILQRRLEEEASHLSFVAGAIDSRGEDGLLADANQRLTLQVTAVPSDSAYWREAAKGSASTVVPKERAVEWLREAVMLKSRVDDREHTVLAIDARHAGVLADPAVANLYRSTYSSPTVEHGFAQAWVVGPTPSSCTRL